MTAAEEVRTRRGWSGQPEVDDPTEGNWFFLAHGASGRSGPYPSAAAALEACGGPNAGYPMRVSTRSKLN